MKIHYVLHIPHPHTHEFEVDIFIENYSKEQKKIVFKLPVWTPGSYLIREYAKNIYEVEAYQNDKKIATKKINKNTWEADISQNNTDKLKISYKGYAFEHSVRTNFIDSSHAFLNPAATFMFFPEALAFENELTLEIKKPTQFEHIITPLIQNDKKYYVAKNFDELVDSPIEIGNSLLFEVDYQGIIHQFAFHQLEPSEDKLKQIKKDFYKIIHEATEIFGQNPCQKYTTIAHFTEDNYGGLEHLSSTALIHQRNIFELEENYIDFLTLFAHEYFHLWNVKRLCPDALWKFDYENENYTRLLWQAEGFTSYFQDLIMRKANLITPEEFLEEQQKRIQTIENQYGNKIQSVAESSLDAWIKGYRPNENSQNTTISYYVKGAILALWFDIMILEKSNGEQNIEHLLKEMYQYFYLEAKKGFDENELKSYLEKYTKENLTDFWQDYIEGTKEIPYTEILEKINIILEKEPKNKVDLGVNVDNQLRITFVKRNGNAFHAGLQVNDKIIALDNQTYKEKELVKILEQKKPTEKGVFTIIRNGLMLNIPIVFQLSIETSYKLRKKDDNFHLLWEKWARIPSKSKNTPFSKLADIYK
ncbi:MAG: M61 family peptidase [Bacteroidetes bacterium]|nr:MAG: M61 family peptidase [Bacteroidota bacterium]TAG91822.1 MAG: M61 family peptidase [Bacteroidota bacterium]